MQFLGAETRYGKKGNALLLLLLNTIIHLSHSQRTHYSPSI